MTWVDFQFEVRSPIAVALGVQLGLARCLLPWYDGRAPGTMFERWYMGVPDPEVHPPTVEVRPPTVRQLGDPRDTTSTWTLLPPPEGTCSQCGRDHDPEAPHDREALHYQYAFYAEHDRWPTWEDAMAHCTDEVYEVWREAFAEHGIEIAARS